MSNVVPFRPRKKSEPQAVGECSDDELYGLLRTSSREAFAELCRRHMGHVFTRISVRSESPDEATREVWLMLWRQKSAQGVHERFVDAMDRAVAACLPKDSSSDGRAGVTSQPPTPLREGQEPAADEARLRSLTELVLLQLDSTSADRTRFRIRYVVPLVVLIGVLAAWLWSRRDLERSLMAKGPKANVAVQQLSDDIDLSVRLVTVNARPLLSGETVASTARFIVAGRNANPSRKAYAMAFIRDSAGQVLWVLPRDEAESDDVSSVLIPTSGEPTSIGSEFSIGSVERGPSTLVTVVSRVPIATVATPKTLAEIVRQYPEALVHELGFHVAQ